MIKAKTESASTLKPTRCCIKQKNVNSKVECYLQWSTEDKLIELWIVTPSQGNLRMSNYQWKVVLNSKLIERIACEAIKYLYKKYVQIQKRQPAPDNRNGQGVSAFYAIKHSFMPLTELWIISEPPLVSWKEITYPVHMTTLHNIITRNQKWQLFP